MLMSKRTTLEGEIQLKYSISQFTPSFIFARFEVPKNTSNNFYYRIELILRQFVSDLRRSRI